MRGRLYGLAIVDTGGGPRQRPEAVGTLELRAAPAGAVEGLLELRGRVGGPFEGGPGAGVYNLNQAFQNSSPSLEVRQAFLEWRGRHAEVRAGIQTFAWGKLDGVPPTDVVNPRDWHDPLVVDEFFEEQKIGVPALLGTWYLPDASRLDLRGVRLAAAWLPWAVPSRLPLLLERWFPRSVDVPSRLCLPVDLPGARRGCPEGQSRVAIDFRTANAGAPQTLGEGAFAVRLAGTWGAADLELSHYTGVDTGPDASIQAVLFDVGPENAPDLRAAAQLVQATHRTHMTGAAGAVPIGPITVRAEAAWFIDRGFLRPAQDLVRPFFLEGGRIGQRVLDRALAGERVPVPLGDLFPRLDAVEWGLGADTLWRGLQPLLQVSQIVILGDAPTLLISNPETRLSGTLRRRFWGERLEGEVRALWEIERGALSLFPRLSWQARENLWLRVGYLVLTGPRNSVLGQFRANDQLVVQARMTF